MNPCFILCIAPCHIQSPGLPDGWVSIQHASGATAYFHRESRVCTWGMPYTIKKGVTVKVRPTVYVCINVVKQLHTCISNCGTYVQYMYCIQWAMMSGQVCTVYMCILSLCIVYCYCIHHTMQLHVLYICMYVHVLSALFYV